MLYNKTLSAKNRGTRGGKVEFIVLHDTAGSRSVNDAHYLANDPDKRGISVDFVALHTGEVYQLNNDLRGHCTYHAGRHTNFRGRSNGAVNQHSIGIEISQKAKIELVPDPKYPDLQVKAIADTCRDICNQFDLTSKDITTHAAIITDHSRTDPRLFPWDKFWAYFNASGKVDQIHHELAPGPVMHTVVAGDTLFSLATIYKTSVEAIKALNHMDDPSMTIVVGRVLKVKE